MRGRYAPLDDFETRPATRFAVSGDAVEDARPTLRWRWRSEDAADRRRRGRCRRRPAHRRRYGHRRKYPPRSWMAALTNTEPVVVSRGPGSTTRAGRARPRRSAMPCTGQGQCVNRPGAAGGCGGADLGAMAGCARAAIRRAPLLLDGLVVTTAALVAERLAPGARLWWQAGHSPLSRRTRSPWERARADADHRPRTAPRWGHRRRRGPRSSRRQWRPCPRWPRS